MYAGKQPPPSPCKFVSFLPLPLQGGPTELAYIINQWPLSSTLNLIEGIVISLFQANVLFLYPVFTGYRKGTLAWNGLKRCKIKDGWINAFCKIMRVRFDRNFGIPQEFLMHNSVFCRLSGLCFFHWSVALLTFSLKCDRSHWKVKIVLLNFKITRTENFSLAKSLRSTYKEVYFLLKMNSFKAIFQILSTLFQRFCLLY